jgi:hypothetical protein
LIKKIKESDETLKSWVVQRDKLSLKYFKEENKKLKNVLNSTKIFLNMVIHDLRNPANQIKYAIEYVI